MDRLEFMNILRSELSKNNVKDIDEIIFDFEEHFSCKMEEGKSEEEIVKKIGNPVEIAQDYEDYDHNLSQSDQLVIKIGLVISDFFVYLSFLIAFIGMVALGVMTIGFIILAVILITTIQVQDLIPSMPYISSLLSGLSMLGFTIIAAIGTIYLYLYIVQWHKTYQRWRKNALNGNIFPSLSMHPKLSKKRASQFKLINMLGVFLGVSMLTLFYIVSAIIAQSFQFWHVWEWFV
jgi:uncharacterized membrane protein